MPACRSFSGGSGLGLPVKPTVELVAHAHPQSSCDHRPVAWEQAWGRQLYNFFASLLGCPPDDSALPLCQALVAAACSLTCHNATSSSCPHAANLGPLPGTVSRAQASAPSPYLHWQTHISAGGAQGGGAGLLSRSPLFGFCRLGGFFHRQ